MKEQEFKILSGAVEVFRTCGIRSVNMDDIARNLGMSKKTLYKYVKDKKDLVNKSIKMSIEFECGMIDDITSRNLNAIDECMEIQEFVQSLLKNTHPSVIYDMKKYHQDAYKMMTEARHDSILTCFKANIEKGQKEGLYREDIHADVISKIYMASVDAIFEPELFPPNEVSYLDLYLELFRYHIRGVASDKGKEYLVEKIKLEKQKNKK